MRLNQAASRQFLQRTRALHATDLVNLKPRQWLLIGNNGQDLSHRLRQWRRQRFLKIMLHDDS